MVERSHASLARRAVMDRIVCGVDGSAAGWDTVRLAATFGAPDGRLIVVAVAPAARAAHPEVASVLVQRASDSALEGERMAGAGAEGHVVVGEPADALLDAAAAHGATLLAVGSHGTGRVRGILTGSVATAALHRARCSVLVARAPSPPTGIVVGLDGSRAAARAADVAVGIGQALGVPVTGIAAGEEAAALCDAPGLSETRRDPRDPVEALLDAAGSGHLVVVGARGVRGVAALGSVSERVAHRAEASVLVVRGPRAAHG